LSWNEKAIKELIKLRERQKLTWEELATIFDEYSPNALRKAYYRHSGTSTKPRSGFRSHIVIPDCQVKPGVDLDYLRCIGEYIVEKKPDVIVCIGDFADMPSLGVYDIGKKSFEGRRYKKDIEATRQGMETLMAPIRKEMERDLTWKPELHLTLGNHEERILRAVNSDPKLDGTIGMEDLGYEDYGWKVHDFLVPVVVDGIAYSHYFTSGAMGRPVSSARALVTKKHQSAIMGHAQNWEIHRDVRADGSAVLGMFVGACYEHDEDYLGPQGNSYGRQIWVLHEVDGKGGYLPKPVSLSHLKRKYGRD
jgi:hypothetical protein